MCLIIQTDATKEISEELFKDFIKRNDDGYGFMWIEKNKIHTKKTEKTNLPELLETYNALKEFNPFIHFRMKTHGLVNHDNTHPYYVGWGIYLMHNGIMHNYGKDTEEVSDTHNFITNFLKPFLSQTKNPHKAIRNPANLIAIEKVIGGGNRLVLGDRGGFIIVNRSIWHEVNNELTGIKGCLVSNTYAWDTNFGKPKVTYYQGNQGYYNGGQGTWESNGYQYPTVVPKQTQLDLVEVPKKEEKKEKDDNTFGFKHWKNNLFYDEDGYKVWAKRGNTFVRRLDLDDKLIDDLDDEEELDDSIAILGHVVETVHDKADVQGITQDEYERILVKEWTQYSPAELCNAVYSEPDEAAVVLYRLAHYNA